MSWVVLVRYGEIGLKGKNRPVFENRLVANIRAAVADCGAGVRKQYGRIVVDPEGHDPHWPDLLDRTRNVFGVVSVSPALQTPLSMEAVTGGAEDVVREYLETQSGRAAITFKVETRRPNKKFPLKSPEINAALGGALLKQFPRLKVDVHTPDITVFVEIREERAYVYTRILSGHGGLPVGSSGKGLLLLSGGIDSPVAGWLAGKRGIGLEAIHFHSFPYTSERSLAKTEDLCRTLAQSQHTDIPFHVINFTPLQEAIQAHVAAPARITVMRRMMVRIAEALAVHRRIPVLITGESVGQVASQTLESIAVINAVTNMPILRPLVTMDKREIIDIAQSIGTYDISILPYDDCCTVFVPDKPETKPRLERIESFESRFDYHALIDDALHSVEVIT